MAAARPAGLLLTGGASRRMGTDKAALLAPEGGATLAARTARLLDRVTGVALEIGPGYTDLPAMADPAPGLGPLVAIGHGLDALRAQGCHGPVIVLATDMPHLPPALLEQLAGHPSARSIVPVAGGRRQPLCARYADSDLGQVRGLVGQGRRAMGDLLAVIDPLYVDADPEDLADVDTPADLDRLGLAHP
jgi:molybdenum cofactor guanylyltransferase